MLELSILNNLLSSQTAASKNIRPFTFHPFALSELHAHVPQLAVEVH